MSAPATLATTAPGITYSIFDLAPGDYIWHAGAFRRVTAVDGRVITMGRHTLTSTHAVTVELVAP